MVKQNVVIIGIAGGATKMTRSSILIIIIVAVKSVFKNYTSKMSATINPIDANMMINFPAVI